MTKEQVKAIAEIQDHLLKAMNTYATNFNIRDGERINHQADTDVEMALRQSLNVFNRLLARTNTLPLEVEEKINTLYDKDCSDEEIVRYTEKEKEKIANYYNYKSKQQE